VRRRAYNSSEAGIAQLVEQLICNHQVAGSIPAAGTSRFVRKSRMPILFSFAIVVALSLVISPDDFARAGESNLTFDQAQMRTAFARDRMEEAESELRRLERKEKSAYEALSAAQERYEKAKADADQVTHLREAAEAISTEARERWQQESERLMRIHKEDEARRRGK
jgi:hypothetical protein